MNRQSNAGVKGEDDIAESRSRKTSRATSEQLKKADFRKKQKVDAFQKLLKNNFLNTKKGVLQAKAEKARQLKEQERVRQMRQIREKLNDMRSKKPLFWTRPKSVFHYGQQLARSLEPDLTAHHDRGFGRLVLMYDHDITYLFRHLEDRGPAEFVIRQQSLQNFHRKDIRVPPQVIDDTLLDTRIWSPLYRKGQQFWEYCRDKWLEKECRIGAVCAPIGCLYSLWSITNNCMDNGGLVFMFMYFLLTVFFTIPSIYMELIIGQYYQCGLVAVFTRMCPLLKGAVYLMALSSIINYALTMTRTTWLLHYTSTVILQSFPWKHCDEHWNTLLCHDPTKDNDTSLAPNDRTPAVEYFRARVLRLWKSKYADEVGIFEPFYFTSLVHDEITKATLGYVDPNKHLNGVHRYSLSDPGYFPNLDLLLCYLAIVFVLYRTMKKSCCDLGKQLLAQLVFGLTLVGACVGSSSYIGVTEDYMGSIGWFYDIPANAQHFLSLKSWNLAIKHAVLSSGIGTGYYITAGSHNSYPSEEIKSAAIASGITNYVLHFILVVFFVSCYHTLGLTTTFKQNPLAFGNDTLFDIFPQLVAQHDHQNYAWMMYFVLYLGLVVFGCANCISSLFTIRQMIVDSNIKYYEPLRVNYDNTKYFLAQQQCRRTQIKQAAERKGKAMMKILAILVIFNAFTFFRGGFLYFYLIEELWYKHMPMFIFMIEACSICTCVGLDSLNEYAKSMTGWPTTMWFRFSWKMCVTTIPVAYLMQIPPILIEMKFDGIIFDKMILNVGNLICLFPPAFILIWMCLVFWKSRGVGCWNRIKWSMTPLADKIYVEKKKRPMTRLHWLHHMVVPNTIAAKECFCVQPEFYEDEVSHLNFPNFVHLCLDTLWYGLRLYKLSQFHPQVANCIPGLEDDDVEAQMNDKSDSDETEDVNRKIPSGESRAMSEKNVQNNPKVVSKNNESNLKDNNSEQDSDDDDESDSSDDDDGADEKSSNMKSVKIEIDKSAVKQTTGNSNIQGNPNKTTNEDVKNVEDGTGNASNRLQYPYDLNIVPGLVIGSLNEKNRLVSISDDSEFESQEGIFSERVPVKSRKQQEIMRIIDTKPYKLVKEMKIGPAEKLREREMWLQEDIVLKKDVENKGPSAAQEKLDNAADVKVKRESNSDGSHHSLGDTQDKKEQVGRRLSLRSSNKDQPQIDKKQDLQDKSNKQSLRGSTLSKRSDKVKAASRSGSLVGQPSVVKNEPAEVKDDQDQVTPVQTDLVAEAQQNDLFKLSKKDQEALLKDPLRVPKGHVVKVDHMGPAIGIAVLPNLKIIQSPRVHVDDISDSDSDIEGVRLSQFESYENLDLFKTANNAGLESKEMNKRYEIEDIAKAEDKNSDSDDNSEDDMDENSEQSSSTDSYNSSDEDYADAWRIFISGSSSNSDFSENSDISSKSKESSLDNKEDDKSSTNSSQPQSDSEDTESGSLSDDEGE